MDECKALTNKILAWINGSSLTINHYYLILPNKYDDIIVCFLKPFLEQGHENSNRQQILKNKQAFKLGSSIAKLITSSWNSQEKLEKVYIFNRKVHHSGIGFKESFQQITTYTFWNIIRIREIVTQDDYADRDPIRLQ